MLAPVVPVRVRALVVQPIRVDLDALRGAQASEQAQPAPRCQQLDGLRLHRCAGDGRDDDVGAPTVRLLQDGSPEVVARPVDDDIRAQPADRVEARRHHVRDDDPARPCESCQQRVQHPDGAGPDDGHRIPEADADLTLAAVTARHRLDQRRLSVRHAVGDMDDVAPFECRARDTQILLEPTIERDAKDLDGRAGIVVAGDTVFTPPAAHAGSETHALSRGEPLDSRADLGHVAGDLVSEDAPGACGDRRMACLEDAQVGATDRGSAHTNQEFVVGHLRYGDLLDDELPAPVEARPPSPGPRYRQGVISLFARTH